MNDYEIAATRLLQTGIRYIVSLKMAVRRSRWKTVILRTKWYVLLYYAAEDLIHPLFHIFCRGFERYDFDIRRRDCILPSIVVVTIIVLVYGLFETLGYSDCGILKRQVW